MQHICSNCGTVINASSEEVLKQAASDHEATHSPAPEVNFSQQAEPSKVIPIAAAQPASEEDQAEFAAKAMANSPDPALGETMSPEDQKTLVTLLFRAMGISKAQLRDMLPMLEELSREE